MGDPANRGRSGVHAKSICVMALLVLVTSCSLNKPEENSKPLAVNDSTIAAFEQNVSQRPMSSIQRVGYPVQGVGDPAQNWGDLYLPAGTHKAQSVPMVVLIHGGGWRSSVGAGDFAYYAQALADRGVAVYNIEYRRVGSGGGWPTTFTDVASALDHVPQIAQDHPELRPDAQVVGHSAGAQLALWAGTREMHRNDPLTPDPKFRPSRIVALSGPLDMHFAAGTGDQGLVNVIGGQPAILAKRYSNVDPIQNLDPKIPVVAVHGTADKTVSYLNSQRYIQALHRAGGAGTLRLLPGDNHGSLIRPGTPNYDSVLDLIASGPVVPGAG
ncbi:alpha/beta hydrolase family protein [Kocuria massiliensis]|uniref:alpha/beta hydrolase family protein n=1 Tax=Kocuria massiliensis TaxID=1926282 RepID=UPI0022B94944|nr:alpha/beta fold hydrolase [Kocuria massiliensis]